MLFSLIFSYVVLKYCPRYLVLIVKGLLAIGIVLHEICHVVMCVLTRTPIRKVSLLKKVKLEDDSGKTDLYGQVLVYEHKISFLQACVVGFAPLFLCFWFFFWILGILVEFPVHPLIFGAGIVVMISIALSAVPSLSDLAMIPKAFSNNTQHSLYQIFLVSLAILFTWLIESFVKYEFHEWHIYLIITGFYFLIKYGFLLINHVAFLIYERKTHRPGLRNFQDKRIKGRW